MWISRLRSVCAIPYCNCSNVIFGGEETGHVLTGHPWCWVIDPNDSTSDFLKGVKGSSISVGLLRHSIPVLGVVYAPITEDRGKDCLAWAEGMPYLLRNGQPVDVDLSQRDLEVGALEGHQSPV
ncbi:inositol monophosphatase family protein [Pseudomonas sp. ACN5]|uniref:inositol monophosphatase family protein n=1 Tax=Pseudomonas sp. ACN5 TaxID=1920427 RepID=UPI0035327553